MDSKALLDYVLFQLTPTRTRCDLVVFSGKVNEKIASGLVEPFLSHLKYAKDQISKGGYSITLRPPTAGDASWFTKATFLRFVRFVSTPEILERVVRIEREISQIESSIQSNEVVDKDATENSGEGSLLAADGMMKKSNNSSKLLPSEEGVQEAVSEENSRIRLQRLLDTRKAILQKEQAMAYARAVVAGYEMDNIDDLLSFADTFGAARLREACMDFKEFYKRKHSDDQWMDELAAVQAYAVTDLSYMGASGILLAGENIHGNGVSTGSLESTSDLSASPNSDGSKVHNMPASEQTPIVQPQLPWMNQIPQFMYNFQGPMHQTPSSYQGYPFPGMQPYYPGHMGWPPPGGVIPQSKDDQHRKAYKKEKSLDTKGTDASEEDEQTESSDSYSGTDSDEVKENHMKHSSKGKAHAKKNKKKSSKTVVIRNINYITSQRHSGEENEISDTSSGGALSLDEASIREGVDSALASLDIHAHSKGRKNRGQRGVVQNGTNGYAEQHSKNDFEAHISDGGKTTNTWDAFQSLLMSHEEPTANGLPKDHPADSLDEDYVIRNFNDGLLSKTGNALDLESEKVKIQQLNADDSVLVIQRGGENDCKNIVDFNNGENPNMKRIVSQDENALFSGQLEQLRMNQLGTPADFAAESSVIKNQKGEDWFVANASGSRARDIKQVEFGNHDTSSFEGGFVHKETATKTPVVDDSFIIQSRSPVDEQYASNWRTDISMVPDVDASIQPNNGSTNTTGVGISVSAEPDELCMVLVRESQESTGVNWTPEMDYQLEISYTEADIKSSNVEANGHTEKELVNGKSSNNKKTIISTAKNSGREMKSKALAGSLAKSRTDPLSKSKKISSASRLMVQKSKLQKEEEERKRKEEQLIERQKRIAERTASRGVTTAASKKIPVQRK